ncbi:MAG: alpha/beta hydrolase [Proteobacteria bacterium]|nr:MAG: alpha/beta hydrolase [Pseudomonadota bacterium]
MRRSRTGVRAAAAAAVAAAAALLLACANAEPPPRYDPVVEDPPAIDAAQPPSLAELVVPSAGAAMNAIVYAPGGAGPHPIAILLHGYPGNERNGDLAQALRRAGWAVLFFHYRGAWGSGGAFSFANALGDVGAALAFVRGIDFGQRFRADAGHVALVGHSMGGFLALAAAAQDQTVGCAVSLAGANLGLFGRAARDPAQRAELAQAFGQQWSAPLRGVPERAPLDELAANADAFDLVRRAPALASRPVLLVAGARDPVTPPDLHHEPLAAALAAAGAERAESLVLDADHAFSSQRIALARAVIEWLDTNCR